MDFVKFSQVIDTGETGHGVWYIDMIAGQGVEDNMIWGLATFLKEGEWPFLMPCVHSCPNLHSAQRFS